MSAMPAWARISVASGLRSTRLRSPSAIGGSPRPPWIRIGTRRSAASSNTGPSRSSVAVNFCARGWSLIPRAPASRQRRASSIGDSLRSSRTNGISRPFDRSANASVRSFAARERRVAVGLVEAEHEGARDAVVVHQLEQLVVVADHAVDVVPEVQVRVEDVGACRQELAGAPGATVRPVRAPWRAHPRIAL